MTRTLNDPRVRRALITLTAVVVFASAAASQAALTPERACQNGRYMAVAKYGACEHKATAKILTGGSGAKFEAAVSKCRIKYTSTWAKLQAKANGSGATCDAARFDPTTPGTVRDRLTGLQWELKTDDGTVHDKDDVYSWNAGGVDNDVADGTAFTTFLAALNAGCFAGQCDWRLPTLSELQTILLEPLPYPCTTSPCVESVFGLTAADNYWSATTGASFVGNAGFVSFDDGLVANFMSKTSSAHVRAVRGGF